VHAYFFDTGKSVYNANTSMLQGWVGLATLVLSVIVLFLINKVRGIEKQFATILDDYIVENNELHKRLDDLTEKIQGSTVDPSFSATTFNGFKDGYIYKTSGPKGAGYYKTPAASAQAKDDGSGVMPHVDEEVIKPFAKAEAPLQPQPEPEPEPEPVPVPETTQGVTTVAAVNVKTPRKRRARKQQGSDTSD
jgi:hypothetical protein